MAPRLDRIRKLVALATDQAGTPEGEVAARLARELMRRQAVRLSELSEDARRLLDPVDRRPLEIGGRETWRRRLAGAVARHCECTLTWSGGRGEAVLYGHDSDMDLAEYLYAVMERPIAAGRAARERELSSVALRDFCHSAVLAVENRLRLLRAEEVGIDPRGTALVLARKDEVEDWLRQRGYRFRLAPPSPHCYDRDGYALGHDIPMHDAVRAEPREMLD